MHDSSTSLIPYLAGFALCVGAVFALVACTTPAGDPADRRPVAVVEQPAD
ncbi:hypothetical protein ACFPER_04205 [Agromyces aurantiacus]|uniref:Lipoprotein n=1 Tax=Agromyces aurantiacus TaxID=165814 RepID=A0ABV9R1I3_9MICO|nr:hypothetical protein [Agromyces aurantiacus]MBM7502659.1 hypothetical protein [Agromyces aurantiacus]